MQCRDAQFYLRLRRHAGDELGAEVTADLGRHLAECPACAADARAAESFDRAVAATLRNVPVPAGLREKLLTQASAYRGGVIRRKVYRLTALAASLFLGVGLAFGVFSATRPRIDTQAMVESADEQLMNPEGRLRDWLVAQKFPAELPERFDPELLMQVGTEPVGGAEVPVAVFRHPTDVKGFAKVYIFRAGQYNLQGLRNTNASWTMAKVIADQPQFRGLTYVIVHTVHPLEHPGDNPLKPFLLPRRDVARL
jgi:hypothetical protein